MRKLILLCLMAVLASVNAHAQILKPVKWSYAAKKIGKDEAVLFIKATIDPG